MEDETETEIVATTRTRSTRSTTNRVHGSNSVDLDTRDGGAATTPTVSPPVTETMTATANEATPLLSTGSHVRHRKHRRRHPLKRALIVVCATAVLGGVAFVAFLIVTRSYTASILLHLFSSLSALSTCSTCFSLLVPIRQLALLGDQAFTHTFTSICIDLRIQPEEVCRGVLQRQGPVIAQSLRQIQPNKRTAAAFCSKVFGLCHTRGGENIQDWPSELFPASEVEVQPRTRRSGKTKKIVHISDVHIDRAYKAGSEAACGSVLCCREPVTSLSDPIQWPAGSFGNPHCDTPYSLFKSMLDAIDQVAGDAVALISTGDVPSHAIWEETRDTTSRDILEAYAIMRSALRMPIYGTIGNHDISPVNLFPTTASPKAFQATQWVYDLHYTAWRDWIGTGVNRTAFVENVGCYSVVEKDMRLRLISLNTNFWNPDDFYLYDTEYPSQDPQGVLRFLMAELQAAETLGQHAIIIGHAAPETAFPAQSHYFDQILQRYRSTVVAQFYGHTHSSTFTVGYSTPAAKTADTASTITFTSGSLTPFGGTVNPGFRVYELDEATGEVWDFHDYHVNMSDPEYNRGPHWKLLYSARKEYGPLVLDSEGKPLGPSFWHSVTEVLDASEDAFRRYIYNRFRGSRYGDKRACQTPRCWKYMICVLRRSRSEEKCDVPATVQSSSAALLVEGENRSIEMGGFPTQDLHNRAFGMKELLQGIAEKAKRGELGHFHSVNASSSLSGFHLNRVNSWLSASKPTDGHL